MKITIDRLKNKSACQEAIDWAVPYLGDGREVEDCLEEMDRANWLIWLLWHTKTVNIRQLVKLACVAGRFSLRHVPPGEDRPRLAFEVAENWVALTPRSTTEAAWAAAWAAGAAEHKNMCVAIPAEMQKPDFKGLQWPV